jgi:hypothetical protein
MSTAKMENILYIKRQLTNFSFRNAFPVYLPKFFDKEITAVNTWNCFFNVFRLSRSIALIPYISLFFKGKFRLVSFLHTITIVFVKYYDEILTLSNEQSNCRKIIISTLGL